MADTLTKELTQTELEMDLRNQARIVVWNDDHNTFEWVIESFVSILRHTYEQAEQCAWFIHTIGKYAVKHGSLKDLRPMKEALIDRGLEATIEEN